MQRNFARTIPIMRHILLVLVLLFHLDTCNARAGAPDGMDALAVVKVEGLRAEDLARIQAIAAHEQGVGIEYTCLWAGIVVFHLEDVSCPDRADVITYLRRMLTQAGIMARAELLDVHLAARGPGKC